MLERLLKNRTIMNAGWLLGGKITQSILNLLTTLLTARYLGPSDYGLINYANAYIAFFSSLSTLGINNILVKELIDNPKREGEILGTSILLRIVSSALSVLTIISIVSMTDRDEPITILVVTLCSIGIFFHVFETLNYWFQAHLNSKITAIGNLIAIFLTAIYKVVLIINKKPVVYFALSTSIDYIVIAIILFMCYRRYCGQRLVVSQLAARQILQRSCHFILPGMMVAIYAQTDKMMLKQMISDLEIGYYSTAVSLCGMWCFVLNVIIDASYPSIMHANKLGDEKEFERLNRILYAIIFYLSITVSCFITLFAEPMIRILYGEAYLPAVNPLRIITWYTTFSYLGGARNAWIVGKNKQKYLIWISLSAAVANVVLNGLFIPILGASGAAFASLITQMITILVTPVLIPTIRRNFVLMIEAVCLKGLRK